MMAKPRISIVLVATLATLNLVHPATAQDDPEACARIHEDSARLECYDLIFRHTRSETEGTEGTGAWQVNVERSRIDDSTNVTIYVEASEPYVNRYGRQGHPTLIIRCKENETNLYIHFAGAFMSDLRGGGRVTYRLDREDASRVSMRESNDHRALGLWSGGRAIPFIRRMLRHQTLLVRAVPHSAPAITTEFRIAGIEQAIQPLREACNW